MIGETREEKSVKTKRWNGETVKNGGKEQMAYYASEFSKCYRCYDYGITTRLQLIFFTHTHKHIKD